AELIEHLGDRDLLRGREVGWGELLAFAQRGLDDVERFDGHGTSEKIKSLRPPGREAFSRGTTRLCRSFAGTASLSPRPIALRLQPDHGGHPAGPSAAELGGWSGGSEAFCGGA